VCCSHCSGELTSNMCQGRVELGYSIFTNVICYNSAFNAILVKLERTLLHPISCRVHCDWGCFSDLYSLPGTEKHLNVWRKTQTVSFQLLFQVHSTSQHYHKSLSTLSNLLLCVTMKLSNSFIKIARQNTAKYSKTENKKEYAHLEFLNNICTIKLRSTVEDEERICKFNIDSWKLFDVLTYILVQYNQQWYDWTVNWHNGSTSL